MCLCACVNEETNSRYLDQHIAIWNDIDVDEDGDEIGVHHVNRKKSKNKEEKSKFVCRLWVCVEEKHVSAQLTVLTAEQVYWHRGNLSPNIH